LESIHPAEPQLRFRRLRQGENFAFGREIIGTSCSGFGTSPGFAPVHSHIFLKKWPISDAASRLLKVGKPGSNRGSTLRGASDKQKNKK